MSYEQENAFRTRTAAGVDAEGIDQGLRTYMLRVYNYMALGLALTAIVSMAIMSSDALKAAVFSLPGVIALLVVWFGIGFFGHRLILTGNTLLAQSAFWIYSAAGGALITPQVSKFLLNGKGDLVVMAFAITSVMFLGTSLIGYTTKRDLSPIGAFSLMFFIGIIAAALLNAFFFQSSMFSLLISSVVVLFMAAMTAYQTQAIKELYYEGDAATMVTGKAILGALALYTSFIVMFMHILNILGIMDD